MEKVIIDGKEAVLGRLGSFVAKELLKGKAVEIYNSEEVIISGRKEIVVEKLKAKKRMGSGGSLKGPKYIRKSDFLLKRMIRGMLPRDRAKGREAFKRLKCFIGSGEGEMVKFEHKKPMKYSKIKEIVEAIK